MVSFTPSCVVPSQKMVSAFISSATAPIARLTPDDTMPCTQSTLSCSTSLRSRSIESLGLVSSSRMISPLRPAIPPAALMRSNAYWVPRKPHSPIVPAMPALGAMMPTRSGVLCAMAGSRRWGCGAMTAPVPPIACNNFLLFWSMAPPRVDPSGYVGVHGLAREFLDLVQQLVARPHRAVLVGVGDGARDVRVQLGGERHVGRLLVVDIPEAARE